MLKAIGLVVGLVPKVVGILRSAVRLRDAVLTKTKLAGSASSRTTKAQLQGGTVVVFVLAVVVAALQAFMPESPFADAGIAEAVLVLLATYLSPYVSRMIGGKPGAVTLEADTFDEMVLLAEEAAAQAAAEKGARAEARVERVKDLTEEQALLELIRRVRPDAERIVRERKAGKGGDRV